MALGSGWREGWGGAKATRAARVSHESEKHRGGVQELRRGHRPRNRRLFCVSAPQWHKTFILMPLRGASDRAYPHGGDAPA